MSSPMTDKEIVERILSGKTEEFRTLLKRYKGLVFHIVRYMIPNEMDREDMGQDIFLKVYQNLSSFRFKSSLATWISHITYNACVSYLRKSKIRFGEDYGSGPLSNNDGAVYEYLQSDSRTACDLSPEKHIESKETIRQIRGLVNDLPANYRAVIALYYLEELDLKEISNIMGIPVGTIKSHLFRARKMLKESILAKFDAEDIRS
jgi:RNA polymerase sigma-70 factor (ECF subfamily)